MGSVTTYTYVTDNNGSICTDNNGALLYTDYVITVTQDFVSVRRVKNKLYPCEKCRFRNSLRMPATDIHAIQQRWKAFSPGIRQGCDPEYAEIIGECKDFKQS